MTVATNDIPYVREDRLSREMSGLSYKRDRLMHDLKRNRKDEILQERLLKVETEICYLYRELEHRVARRDAHAEYQKNKKFSKNRANRR